MLRVGRPELHEVALHTVTGTFALRKRRSRGPANAADTNAPGAACFSQHDDLVRPARVHGPHRDLPARRLEVSLGLLVPIFRVGVPAAGDVQTPRMRAEERAAMKVVGEVDGPVKSSVSSALSASSPDDTRTRV